MYKLRSVNHGLTLSAAGSLYPAKDFGEVDDWVRAGGAGASEPVGTNGEEPRD